MELDSDSNHFIIQTSGNSEEQNLILESNTILICSEDGDQEQYVPYAIENGQILLKKLSDSSIERLEFSIKDETNEIPETTEKHLIPNQKQPISNPKQNNKRIFDLKTQKRKLSYQTEFQPCSLPPNRGGMKNIIRYGRKHLIIDQQIMISPREFKAQLNHTDDTVMRPELAPCTRQLMRHMLTGITKLFAYPSHKMPSNKLLQLYVSNCTSQKQPNEENLTDMHLLPLGYKMEVDTSKIKRITRKRRYPEAEEYLRQQSLLKQEENDDMQQLVDAANSASADHGYTIKEEDDEIRMEEVTCEGPQEDNGEIYILQNIDDNTQSNIEVLLAAAQETNQDIYQDTSVEYQTIEKYQEIQSDDGIKHVYIVQEGTDEVIFVPPEYILS